MLRYLAVYTVGKLVAWPIRRRLRAFDRLTREPQRVQEQLLREFVALHADTQFGRDHGFSTIKSVADFRKQVPVAPYEYVQPYIEKVQRGETRALLTDSKVLMFALTSGTTASRKYIPVTPRYLADYRRGWNMWGLRTFRDHKGVSFRPIVQLAGDPDEMRTEAGIPCGSISGFTT
ncbi:MAG: GH3 auxin-responsive promoter family protein, partial [Gemmataceae bacterium]